MQIDNVDEKTAEEWLRKNNHRPVQCKADPPDYLIDGDIAVEVTRLSRGEESTLVPLRKVAKEVLKEYVFPDDQPGWDVDVDRIPGRIPGRSLPETEETKRIIRVAVRKLMKCNCYYHEDKNSRIEIYFVDNPSHSGFVLKGTDFGEGEWEGDVIKKIQLCVDKKMAKVKRKFSQHKEWWLLLADHAHPGLAALALVAPRSSIDIKSWSKVVVLDFHSEISLELGVSPSPKITGSQAIK